MDIPRHFRLSHDPFRAERDAADPPMLSPEDARRFVASRAAAAGQDDLFSSAALDVLAETSRGRTAALRLLAGNALFHAAFDGARRVEETHARQAAATQDIWRDVPVPPTVAPQLVVSPAATTPADALRPAAPIIVPAAAVSDLGIAPNDDGPPPPRRGWWRTAPPLARLAIVVGLLLLSLPVIGYVVGAVKDDRPSTESSYLPDEGEIAEAEAPVDGLSELPPPGLPAAIEVATARPPIDLTAQTMARDRVGEAPPEIPAAVGAGSEDGFEPAPVAPPQAAEPATMGGRPRVFVHYSASQPGGADAAAAVAQSLRGQGYTVADLRAVPESIDTASVRYFFAADRADAEALHDALGAALRGRGFSAGDLKSMAGYDPAPRRGTLEVWVPAG